MDSEFLNASYESGVSGREVEKVEELLTVNEVAALLKVRKSWIYERTRCRGPARLPFIKLGKYLRFEEKQVMAFLQRNRKWA